jgi:DnaJ-class molecular chaperone
MTVHSSLQEAAVLFKLQAPFSALLVKQRYRQLAKNLHPDTAGGSQQAFIRLQGAYRLLLQHCENPTRHDPIKHAASQAKPEGRNESSRPSSSNASHSDMAKTSGVANAQPLPTHVTIAIAEAEAKRGGKHTLTLDWQAVCHRCGVVGATLTPPHCNQCKGKGTQAMQRKVTFMVPKGIAHGAQLRLGKQGIPFKGHPTDLLITFNITGSKPPVTETAPPASSPQPQAASAQNTAQTIAQTTLTLTLWEAMLGGIEKTILTPMGPVVWHHPEGKTLQPGTIINVALPGTSANPNPGSQPWPVAIKVSLPTLQDLSPDSQELLRLCARLNNNGNQK